MSGAGWSSLAARRAHNPKVAGSNPAPATNHRGRHSRAGDVGHFFSVRDSRPSFPGAARNAMSVGMRCLPRTRKSEGVHPRAPMCWITLGLARGNAERAGAGRGRPRNSSDERPHDMPGGMLAGRGSCRCPPIGVSSVRNANDQHDEFIVADCVHHAIVAAAPPAQPSQVALQGRAEIGGLRPPVYGRDDARPVRFGDTPQFLGGALVNPYRVAGRHSELRRQPEPDPVLGWGIVIRAPTRGGRRQPHRVRVAPREVLRCGQTLKRVDGIR